MLGDRGAARRDGPLAIKLAYEELYSKTISHGDAIAEVHRTSEIAAGSALSPAKQLRSSMTAGAREFSPAKLDICSTSNSLTPSGAGRSYGGASAQPMSYAARHSRALASQRASAEKVGCATRSPSGRPPPSPTRSSTASAIQSKPCTTMGRTASAVVAALAVDAALPDLDAQALALLEAIMSPSALAPPTLAEEPMPEPVAPASSALANNNPVSPRTGAKLSASIRATTPASYAAMSHSRNHAPVATVGQEQPEQQDSPPKSARALSAPSAVRDDGGNAESTEDVEKQPQGADDRAAAGAPRHVSAAGAACGVGTGGQKLAVARLSYDVPCGASSAVSAVGMRLEEAVLDGSTKGLKRLDNGMSAAGSAAGCASGAASSTTLPPTGPANTSAPGAAGQQPSGARAIIRRMCRSHAGRNTSSRSLRGEDGWRPTYTELEGFRLGTTPAAPPQPLPESPSAPASGALPKSPLGSTTVAAAAAALAAACLPVGGSEELDESGSGGVPLGIVTAPGALMGGATQGAGAGSQRTLVAIREVASIQPPPAADPQQAYVPANAANKQPQQQPKAKSKLCFSLFACFGACAGATSEDTVTPTSPPVVKPASVAHAPADGGTIAAARYPEPSSPQAILPSTPNAEALERLPQGDIIATLDAAAGLPSHPSLPTSSPFTGSPSTSHQAPRGLTAPRPRGSTSPGGQYHHHSHRSTGGKPMLHSPQHHSARGTLLGPGRPSGSQFPSRTTTPRKLSTQPGSTAGGATSQDVLAAMADGSVHKGTGGCAASMLPGPVPSAEPHLPAGYTGRSSRGGRPPAAVSGGSNASGSRGVSPRTLLSDGTEAAEAGLASSAEGGQGATFSRASVESARPSLRQPRGSGSGAGYAALPSYRGPLGAARAVDLGASSLGGVSSPATSRPRSRSRLQHTMSDAIYAAAAALAPSDAASVDSRRATFSPRETRSPRVSAHTGATYAAAAAAAAIANAGAAAATAPMSTGGIANDAAAPGPAATANLGTTAQLTAQLPPPAWPPSTTPQPSPAPAPSAASPASAAPTPVLPSSAPPAMAGVSRRSRKRTRIPHPCGSSLAQLDARKLASMSLEQMLEEIQAAIWADDVARGRTPSVAPGGVSTSLPALASAVRLTGGVSSSGRSQPTRRSTAGGRSAGRSIGGTAAGGGGTSAGGGVGVGVQTTPMKAVSGAPAGVSPLLGPSASRRRRVAWSRSPSIGARPTAAAGAVDTAGSNTAAVAVTSLTPNKPTAATARPACASAPSSSNKPAALRSSSPGPLGTLPAAARSRSPPPGRWSATPSGPHRTTSPSPPRFTGLPPASPGSGAATASQRVWKHGGRALGPALSAAAAVGSSLPALPSASPGNRSSGDKHPLRQSPYKKALRAPPGSMEAAVAAALASPAQHTSPAPHFSASPASKGTTTPPTTCQPDATAAAHHSARLGSVALALPPQLMSSTGSGSSVGTASSTAAARVHPVDAIPAPPPQPAATAPALAPLVCSTLDLSQLLRACDTTPAASANPAANVKSNVSEDRNSSKDLSTAAGPPISADQFHYEGLDKEGKLSHASSTTVLPTEEEVFRQLAHLVIGQGQAGGPVVEVSEGPQEEQHQALQRPAVVVVQHVEQLAPGPGGMELQHEWASAGELLLMAVPGGDQGFEVEGQKVGSSATWQQQRQQCTSAVTLTELLGQVLAGEEVAAASADVHSDGQRPGHSHRGSRGDVEEAIAGMLLAPGREESLGLQAQFPQLDTTEAAAAAVIPHSSGGSGSEHLCAMGSVEQEAARPGPELEAVEVVAAVGVGLTRSLGSMRGALEQARLLEQVQLMQRVTTTAARSQGGAPSGRPLLPPRESEPGAAEECGVLAASAMDGLIDPLDPSCLAVAAASGAEAVRSPFQDANGAAAAVLAALSGAQLQSKLVVQQQEQQQGMEPEPTAGAHTVGHGVLLGVHGVRPGTDSCSVGGGTLEYHAALSPRTSAGQGEPLSPVEPHEVVGAESS